jgi:hypothetical protein
MNTQGSTPSLDHEHFVNRPSVRNDADVHKMKLKRRSKFHRPSISDDTEVQSLLYIDVGDIKNNKRISSVGDSLRSTRNRTRKALQKTRMMVKLGMRAQPSGSIDDTGGLGGIGSMSVFKEEDEEEGDDDAKDNKGGRNGDSLDSVINNSTQYARNYTSRSNSRGKRGARARDHDSNNHSNRSGHDRNRTKRNVVTFSSNANANANDHTGTWNKPPPGLRELLNKTEMGGLPSLSGRGRRIMQREDNAVLHTTQKKFTIQTVYGV